MNAAAEEYFNNKSLLSLIGGWPYQRKILRVLLPSVITAIQLSLVASVILLMFKHSNDIDMLIDGLITSPMSIGVITKLMNLVVNNGKLKHLLRLMYDHWRTFNSESELHILRYYADIGRKVRKCYAVFFSIALVIYVNMPLMPKLLDIIIPLNESRPLVYVYQGEYGIDQEKYYYLIWLHSCVVFTTSVTIIIVIDTLYMTCVLHACSLFVAIGHCLENIVSENDIETDVYGGIYTNSKYLLAENTEKRDSTADDYCKIIACLKKHQLALEYVQKLNSIFTFALFVHLIINVLLISLMGIQLINYLGQKEEMINCISLIISVLFHLICLCLPGQLIIDRSTEVFNKAYSSRWYTFSVRSKQLLRIMLCRSLVPSTLTAGNMYVMSMVTCGMILQTSMSYFTALLSMK